MDSFPNWFLYEIKIMYYTLFKIFALIFRYPRLLKLYGFKRKMKMFLVNFLAFSYLLEMPE